MKKISQINSFAFAPINTGFASDGVYDKRIFEFHKKRSGNGISISYVGNVATSNERLSNFNTASFVNKNLINLKQLAAIITNEGSIPGIQIASRFAPREAERGWGKNKNTALLYRKFISELCDYEIEAEINAISSCANLAAELGYEIIQIHAAHGYFLSLMLSDYINIRSGKYSYDSPHILKSIVDNFKRVHSDKKIAIRLNIIDGIMEARSSLKKKIDLFQSAAKLGFDIISLSNGLYDISKKLIYPSGTFSYLNLKNAILISQQLNDVEFEAAGNIHNLLKKNYYIPRNLTLCLGKAFIADPHFIQNLMAGNVNRCNDCGLCHYYSADKPFIECPALN